MEQKLTDEQYKIKVYQEAHNFLVKKKIKESILNIEWIAYLEENNIFHYA